MARIAGVNIPQNKVLHVALTYIHGIGKKHSNDICTKLNHKCETKYLVIRSDDNEKTIYTRYATYEKETLPILNYYKKQNLLTNIDGMNKIDEIYKEIRQIMTSLKT